MTLIKVDKVKTAKVETTPFQFTIVPGFISAETIKQVNATYPKIEKGGSFPIDSLTPDMTVQAIIQELDGPEFETAIAQKFDVDLAGKPKMYSLRGYTRAKDGQIHTDSKDKIITVLLYLNENWTSPKGRLRLLKDGKNLEDYIAEVPPDNGTLLIFKRSDNSWHGHHPYEGMRRSLQMNWMTTEGSKGFHAIRHKISSSFKKLTGGY